MENLILVVCMNVIQESRSKVVFLTFPVGDKFSIPIIFSNLNSNCSNLSHLRNLLQEVNNSVLFQKSFWPFTVWINFYCDLKILSLEFQKFFSITRTIFSHSRAEQFWKQNAKSMQVPILIEKVYFSEKSSNNYRVDSLTIKIRYCEMVTKFESIFPSLWHY
jgi:hypothetical protein